MKTAVIGIYFAMLNEASRVVADGVASHEEVNPLMTDCYGWPVGPFTRVEGGRKGLRN